MRISKILAISFYKNKAFPIQWKSQLNHKNLNRLDTIIISNYIKNNLKVPDHYFENRKHFGTDITHTKMDMTYVGR